MAIKNTKKEYISIVVYLAGAGMTFLSPVVSILGFFAVAIMWFIPDSRIEQKLYH